MPHQTSLTKVHSDPVSGFRLVLDSGPETSEGREVPNVDDLLFVGNGNSQKDGILVHSRIKK